MNDFDVIVVGAGAAGGPLAARLSENADRRVLLVEAGPCYASQDEYPQDLLDPGLMTGYLPTHPQNWAFAAQLTAEKPHAIARGKAIGGSTTLNGAYFVRARKRDFDAYEALGNHEWSWEKVLPFYAKLENDLDFPNHENHSGTGPVPVSRAAEDELTSYSKAFIAAALDEGFPWEEDKNGDQPIGIGRLPCNIRGATRMSTGLTYINPVRDRPNLTVWGDVLARRIVFNDTRVTGLEVGRDGAVETIAAPQVILAAGAFKSPHLLALSGVAPAAELEAAGIPVLADLPGVGKKFSDHPSVPLNWTPKEQIDQDGIRFAMQTVLHLNSSNSEHDGDIELLPIERTMLALVGLPRGDAKDLPLNISVQARSRGSITTVSADPEVEPRIEYNYLSDNDDLARLRSAVRLAAKLLRSEAFAPYFAGFADLNDDILADDARIDEWLALVLDTAIHAAGSAQMGDDPLSGHVVDQRGRVHGITGLRVADTSILPFTPSRGPSATATMIGERVASFFEEDVS